MSPDPTLQVPAKRHSPDPDLPGPGLPSPDAGAVRSALTRAAAAFVRQREAALICFIVFFGIVLTLFSPVFLTGGNLRSLLLGLSVKAIVAVGMTVLLVSGGFDLSVGSVLALGGMVAGLLVLHGTPVVLAVLAALAAGVVVGAVNGVLVAKGGINPLIQTLGMMSVVRGLVLLLGGGFGATGLPSSYTAIGQTLVLTLQMPIIIMIVLVVVGDVLLRRSRFLRTAYYIGGNEKAARLTGIRVDRLKITGYVLTAVLAALAGVVTSARFGSASVDAGSGLELQVIAAVVIGGASLSGGSGSVLGALLGVLLTELIVNALDLFSVPVYWQPIAIGAVLIIAVGSDALTGRLRLSRVKAIATHPTSH